MMKQKDERYERWLADIRNRQPVLKHPEELTKSILNSISRAERARKKRIFFLAGSWITGIAAALVLLLLVNDTCFAPVPLEMKTQSAQDKIQSHSSSSLPDNWKQMRLLEKTHYLSEQYGRQSQPTGTERLGILKEKRLKHKNR